MAIKIFFRAPIHEMGNGTWKSYHSLRTNPHIARFAANKALDADPKVN
jgi:hypothetical protein